MKKYNVPHKKYSIMEKNELSLVNRLKDNLKKSVLDGKKSDPMVTSLMESSVDAFVDITWSTAKSYFELKHGKV